MTQDSKADYPDKGAGVDPSEGAREADSSAINLDPSEDNDGSGGGEQRGGSGGQGGGHGGHGPGSSGGGGGGRGGSSRPQQAGGLNPVQHSE